MGFFISSKGIEPNPEKNQAIMNMTLFLSVKEVQRLTGRIVALNIFISHLR